MALYDGETFDVDGVTFTFRTEYDDSGDAPWDRCTPLADVTGWERRSKAPGERIVNSDGGRRRFYDFAEAVAAGRKQGCGFSKEDAAQFEKRHGRKPTAGDGAAAAAEAEYQRFRGWCNDQWHYVGVIVTAVDEDGNRIDHDAVDSLWGIESDCEDYMEEVARDTAAGLARAINADRNKAAAAVAAWDAYAAACGVA